jgi:hypothetical protein
MPFERPALIRLAVIFGMTSLFYALAAVLAMHLSDQLRARAEAHRQMQTQMVKPVTENRQIAPLNATSTAAP